MGSRVEMEQAAVDSEHGIRSPSVPPADWRDA
jgi:hypothetical protein